MQVQAQSFIESGPTVSFGEPTQRRAINRRRMGPALLHLRAHRQCRMMMVETTIIPYAATVRKAPCTHTHTHTHTRTRTTGPPSPTAAAADSRRHLREDAAVRHVEGRRGSGNVDPGGSRRSRRRNHDGARRSEEVRRRSEGGDDRIPSVRNGGVSAGLELGPLQLLPLLLVGILVAAEGLGVGKFPAAVLAFVLPVPGAAEAAGVRRP